MIRGRALPVRRRERGTASGPGRPPTDPHALFPPIGHRRGWRGGAASVVCGAGGAHAAAPGGGLPLRSRRGQAPVGRGPRLGRPPSSPSACDTVERHERHELQRRRLRLGRRRQGVGVHHRVGASAAHDGRRGAAAAFSERSGGGARARGDDCQLRTPEGALAPQGRGAALAAPSRLCPRWGERQKLVLRRRGLHGVFSGLSGPPGAIAPWRRKGERRQPRLRCHRRRLQQQRRLAGHSGGVALHERLEHRDER